MDRPTIISAKILIPPNKICNFTKRYTIYHDAFLRNQTNEPKRKELCLAESFAASRLCFLLRSLLE